MQNFRLENEIDDLNNEKYKLKSKLRTAKVDLHHGLTDLNQLIVKNDDLVNDTCTLLEYNEDQEKEIRNLERRNS